MKLIATLLATLTLTACAGYNSPEVYNSNDISYYTGSAPLYYYDTTLQRMQYERKYQERYNRHVGTTFNAYKYTSRKIGR